MLDARRLHQQGADSCQRAVLALPVDAEAHFAGLSASLRQNLGRCRRRLQEQGDLRCQTLREPDLSMQVVEDFLALEHMGWKGEHGSSLRADPVFSNSGLSLERVDRRDAQSVDQLLKPPV